MRLGGNHPQNMAFGQPTTPAHRASLSRANAHLGATCPPRLPKAPSLPHPSPFCRVLPGSSKGPARRCTSPGQKAFCKGWTSNPSPWFTATGSTASATGYGLRPRPSRPPWGRPPGRPRQVRAHAGDEGGYAEGQSVGSGRSGRSPLPPGARWPGRTPSRWSTSPFGAGSCPGWPDRSYGVAHGGTFSPPFRPLYPRTAQTAKKTMGKGPYALSHPPWWRRWDSNPRHHDYESCALTT